MHRKSYLNSSYKKNCLCFSELLMSRNNLIIIIFLSFSFLLLLLLCMSLYFSNQITFFSFIIGQNQQFNQSTNPIAKNIRTKKKKRKLMSLSVSHFLSHECIYLISYYIAIEEETRTYRRTHTNCLAYQTIKKREREKEVSNRKKK